MFFAASAKIYIHVKTKTIYVIFQIRKKFFSLRSRRVARELTVAVDHPAAGDDDAYRIFVAGHAHSAAGFGLPESPRRNVGSRTSPEYFTLEIVAYGGHSPPAPIPRQGFAG
jgi:hypothetical protein